MSHAHIFKHNVYSDTHLDDGTFRICPLNVINIYCIKGNGEKIEIETNKKMK